MKLSNLIMLPVFCVFAIECAGEDNFYSNKSEGWHWYSETEEITFEDPPPPVEEPIEPPKPTKPKNTQPVPEGPKPLSHDWVKENLQAFLTNAIDNPTEESARAYLYLQRIANDKAQGFAEASKLAILKDPFLSENNRQPSSSFGEKLFARRASRNKSELLRKIAGETELWYFFKGNDCEECDAQSLVVAELKRKYGYNIRAITLDGTGSTTFPNPQLDTGQFDYINFSSYPALALAKPPSDVIPISEGMSAVTSLEKAITVLSANRSWISEEDLNSTRAVNNIALELKVDETDKSIDLSDPAEFLKYLESQSKGSNR